MGVPQGQKSGRDFGLNDPHRYVNLYRTEMKADFITYFLRQQYNNGVSLFGGTIVEQYKSLLSYDPLVDKD